MGQRPLHALGLILIAVLVLAAAGCGGGTKSAATTTSPATTAKASTTTTAASGLGTIASAANCKQLADLGTKFSTAMSGTNPQDTKKVAQLLDEFAAKTPAEIRPDFKVVADAYSKVADAVGTMKPGGVPDAKALGKPAKLATEIDTAKLTAASEHISAWVQKSCHP